MSNTFNAGRQVLPRPKVCLSKPPGAPPPATIVCLLTNVPPDIDPFGQFSPAVQIGDTSQAAGTPIPLTATVSIGTVTFPATIPNESGDNGTWDGDGNTGLAEMEIVFNSPSGAFCRKTATFQVI